MITDPLFYLYAIPAVLLYGIAKGGFGGNIAILSVPLMAMVVAPQQAAAILLPILCAMDLVALRTFRGRWDKTNLRIILPAALVGVALGALTFRYLNDSHIKLLIGGIALLFTLNILLRRGVADPRPASLWRGSFWGMISGFTSYVAATPGKNIVDGHHCGVLYRSQLGKGAGLCISGPVFHREFADLSGFAAARAHWCAVGFLDAAA